MTCARRCSRGCVFIGVAIAVIIIGSLTSFGVLDKIHRRLSFHDSALSVGKRLHLQGPPSIPEPVAVRFERRQNTKPTDIPVRVETVALVVEVAAKAASKELPAVLLSAAKATAVSIMTPAQGDDIPSRSCTNTGQGRAMVTDSDGFTCSRDQLGGGCCRTKARSPLTGQYSCATCSADISCCAEYELCVSCCMSPAQRPTLALLASRSVHSAIRSMSSDPFGVCRYKCRTSSGSVVHENTYRSKQKHCFGLNRPPLMPGVSVNSDLSTAKELAANRSSVYESTRQALDPFVAEGAPARDHPAPPQLPCKVDSCGALVPRKYP